MGERLKGWYLRDVIAQLKRLQGDEAVARLRHRLPGIARDHLDAMLAHSAPPGGSRRASLVTGDGVPLGVAEEVLLAIDGTLGDGSGRLLESIAQELAYRLLSDEAAVVVPGDLAATMARLRMVLERPFEGVPVDVTLTATPGGFEMTVAVGGHPRSTRILRYLTAGTIRAAHRYSRAVGTERLRILGDTTANRAHLSIQLRAPTMPPGELEHAAAAAAAVASRRRPSTMKLRAITQPSLSAEVERIMTRSRSVPPPPPPDGVAKPGEGPEPQIRPPRVPKID